MKFEEWYDEDDWDLFSFPEKPIKEAWNASAENTRNEVLDEVIEIVKEYDVWMAHPDNEENTIWLSELIKELKNE